MLIRALSSIALDKTQLIADLISRGPRSRPRIWWICRQVGYPAVIRVDSGSEFISCDQDLRAYQKGVVLPSPGDKPTNNSYIESFNGKLRVECLNARWFMSLGDIDTVRHGAMPEQLGPLPSLSCVAIR